MTINECIFCENNAEYIFSCLHDLCKKCYKKENFCIICNTFDIKINKINQINNISIHTDYIYLDSEERAMYAAHRGRPLMQLRTY